MPKSPAMFMVIFNAIVLLPSFSGVVEVAALSSQASPTIFDVIMGLDNVRGRVGVSDTVHYLGLFDHADDCQ